MALVSGELVRLVRPTIEVESDSSFQQRIAGHVETRRDSVSDPAPGILGRCRRRSGRAGLPLAEGGCVGAAVRGGKE